MKRSCRFLNALLVVSLVVACAAAWAGTAHAATLLWDANGIAPPYGGTGPWNTADPNWYDGSIPGYRAWVNANNDTAAFGATAGTVTLGEPITVGGLTFSDSAGYVITGNTLTFGTAGSITANVDATIASGLAGSVAITKDGVGTLTFNTTTKTYTGETKVNAGTLLLVAGLSNVASRVVTVDNTSLTGSTLNNNGGDYNVGNGVSGNVLTIQNGGFVTNINNFNVGNGAGDNNNKVTVDGSNSKLDVGKTLSVGVSGSYNTLEILNGATVRNWLWSSGYTYVGEVAGSNYNTVLIDGAGSQWLAGGVCTMRFGYKGSHNTMTISNGGYLYNGFQTTLGGTGGATGGDNTVTITDPGSQWKTDSWFAMGRNSQNNALLIKNGGTLTVDGTSSMGNSGGTNNTATVTGAGSIWNANGGMSLGSSTNTMYISSGGLLNTTGVSGGTFNLGDGLLGAGGVFSTVTANNLAPVNLNFNKGVLVAKQNNAALITGTVTLNGPAYIDTASYTDTIGVAMGGVGSLTKQGAGTLTLSAANTYTGETIVEGGTLSIQNLGDGLADASTVRIFASAVMDLNFAVETPDTITALYLDGEKMRRGDYGNFNYPSYFTGTGLLKVVPIILPGDANEDGVVDAADYIIVKQNFGMTGATWSQGNFSDGLDGVGTVDWDDLQILMTNFGTRSVGGAPAAPEPGSVMLLMFGAAALLRRRAIIGRTSR